MAKNQAIKIDRLLKNAEHRFQQKYTNPRTEILPLATCDIARLRNQFNDVFAVLISNHIFHYTRCITPKRVTSLRGPYPRHCARATQVFSKKRCKTKKQWRAVGDTVPNLNGLRLEPQTSRSRDERVTARPTMPRFKSINFYHNRPRRFAKNGCTRGGGDFAETPVAGFRGVTLHRVMLPQP